MNDKEKKHWDSINGKVAKAFGETPAQLYAESQQRLQEENYHHAKDLAGYKCHTCDIQRQKDEYADYGVLSMITELWAIHCENCPHFPSFLRRHDHYVPVKGTVSR